MLTWKQIRDRAQPSFHNAYGLYKKVDALPTDGPGWSCEKVHLPNDEPSAELWLRDPVDAIRELISNPAFADKLVYAPEKLFKDADKTNRVLEEMNSGDWWWSTQVSYSHFVCSHTYTPIIVLGFGVRDTDPSAWWRSVPSSSSRVLLGIAVCNTPSLLSASLFVAHTLTEINCSLVSTFGNGVS